MLDIDESEGFFASWPRVIAGDDDGEWRMIYHAFDGSAWRPYTATRRDRGCSWCRAGSAVREPGDEDAFDAKGIGTRAVAPWRGGHLMVFEGVDTNSTHHLGVAESTDGGASWRKLEALPGCSSPGGPVLSPGGAGGAWTAQVVGTPYLVALPDSDELRLFHCAKAGPDANMSIGVLVSRSGDVAPSAWQSLPAMC